MVIIGSFWKTPWYMALSVVILLGGLLAYVLIKKPIHLYGPADYPNPEDFSRLLGRVESLELQPLLIFSRLSEPARTLLLNTYHHLALSDAEIVQAKAPTLTDKKILWERLAKRFGSQRMSEAENELYRLGWISRSPDHLGVSEKGVDAHHVLKEFIYSRFM